MIRPPPKSTLFPHPTPFRSAIRPRLPRLRQHALSAMLARRPDGTDRAVGPQVFLCRGCPDGMATPEMGRTRTARRLEDRKSTRLNSSHANISYYVFCLTKKT